MLCRWSLKLIFKAKVKLESGNQKIQYGCQATILKVTSLKINRLLPMATINMHMKFEIEIPKQTWLMLRKPCRLQTDRRTDGQTDRRTRWIQYTPPPTSLGGGITRTPAFWGYPLLPHDYPYCWVILDSKSKKGKVKVTNLKNWPNFLIWEFWNNHYLRHTFWNCTIRCANMIRCADGQMDNLKPEYLLSTSLKRGV